MLGSIGTVQGESTMRLMIRLGLVGVCLATMAQAPPEMDLQALKQGVVMPQTPTVATTDTTPKLGALTAKSAELKSGDSTTAKEELQVRENVRLEGEIKGLKAQEKGPRRFAADLFDTRQINPSATTEGGISEDYVLGTGDSLAVNVFGSATFEVPASVDGRGELLIPKVGSVKVAGLTPRAGQAGGAGSGGPTVFPDLR